MQVGKLALSTFQLLARSTFQLLARFSWQLLALSSWHRNSGSAERNKEVQRGATPRDECSTFAVEIKVPRVDELTGGQVDGM